MAEADAKKELCVKKICFIDDVISVITEYLSNVKWGKKYEHLLEVAKKFPEETFYSLKGFSDTRFAAYSYLAFKAFLADSKLIIASLEERVFKNM